MNKRITVLFTFFMTLLFSASAYQQEIELLLMRTTRYEIAVTNAAISSSDNTITTIPSNIEVDTVTFTYDKSTRELEKTASGSYYVSYVFAEYNTCTLTARTDGDLILEGRTKANAASSEKVSYIVDIQASDSETVSLYSASENEEQILSITTPATKLGQIIRGSFALTLKPVEGSESVIGKSVGRYTSEIILTLTENA